MTTIFAVVGLYFHFQLLTNLAHIAERYVCPEKDRLLFLRAFQAVFTTLFALPFPWQKAEILTSVIMIASVVVIVIVTCHTLFSLAGSLSQKVPGNCQNP